VAGFFKSELATTVRGRQRSKATVLQIRRITRQFLVWAHQKGYVERIPLPREEMAFVRKALDGADRPITIHGGKVWLTQQEMTKLLDFEAFDPATQMPKSPVLWRSGPRTRVTVDRQSQAGAVFAIGSTHFNATKQEEAGLYTVIEWLDADTALKGLILNAFVRLGDAGIGGERNYGYGHFEPEIEAMDEWLISADSGGFFTTLAPYHPGPGERAVLGEGSRYAIVLRRGWLSLAGYQNLRRASVRMVGDGSVLRWSDDVEPFGDLVDVTPARLREESEITVFRYGLAFPIRVANDAVIQKEDLVDLEKHQDKSLLRMTL
jgi:hypothetical protein